MKEYSFVCPHCGSADLRRSRRQSFLEVPRMLTGVYPFRCLACNERFFGNVWILATSGFANCPRCLRLDIAPSIKTHLTNFERLLILFGAHTYRCIPCRHCFFSFRKRISSSA